MTVGAPHPLGLVKSLDSAHRKPAGCILWRDRDGCFRLLSASSRLLALLLRNPEDVVGRPIFEVLGADRTILDEALNACLDAGEPFEVDLSAQLSQRGAIPCRLVLIPHPGVGETGIGVQLLLIDLHAETRPLAALFGTIDDILVRYRLDLTVIDCSESYAKLYSRRPVDMVGRNLAEWLPKADLDSVRGAIREAGTQTILYSSEVTKTLSDGSKRWYRWLDIALPSRPGEPAELLAVGVDITALKRAKAGLRDAIESISDGFVLFDKDGKLVLFNRPYAEMFSRSAPVLREGVHMAELLRYSAASGELGDIADPVEFARGVIDQVEANPTLRYPRQLANGRWILISQYRTADGGYVGLRTDITAVKANEEALQRTRDELERKNAELTAIAEALRTAQLAAEDSNRAKSRFLAHMSHELRTPLNGILGFADIMRAGLFGPVEPERYRDYIGLIHNSGELLLSLINDILDMSKIEAGRMELHIETVETAALAESCRAMVAGMARDSSVALKIAIDPDCAELTADERAAKQMIINLMSNAVKFTPAGGVVTLHFHNIDAARVAISISDNGIGMTPAEREKALQPFGQVDSELARHRKGTGIGLTLVTSLAELHGGKFDLASEKDVGTTATITLPRKRI